MIDIAYPESVARNHALIEQRDKLMQENINLRETVKDVLNVLLRPHSRDELVMIYNRQQISKLLKRLEIARATGANMNMLDRERATAPGFVWIPTGHALGIPSGIVGYWHGERDEKSNPQVEFTTGIVSVDASAIFTATDTEIDNDAI